MLDVFKVLKVNPFSYSVISLSNGSDCVVLLANNDAVNIKCPAVPILKER